MSATRPAPPMADVPSLAIRWDGLVVTIDATTLNTLVRRATYRVKEIREILVEPEGGRLILTIKARWKIPIPLRGEVTSIRLKDGFLGFAITDLKMFGFVRVFDVLLRKIVAKLGEPGRAFFYPEDRVIVISLEGWLPRELSLNVRDVRCEHGELKLFFGPSQYRLDRILEEIGTDPFAED